MPARRAKSLPQKQKQSVVHKSYVPDSLKPKKTAAYAPVDKVNKKTGTRTRVKGVPLKRGY